MDNYFLQQELAHHSRKWNFDYIITEILDNIQVDHTSAVKTMSEFSYRPFSLRDFIIFPIELSNADTLAENILNRNGLDLSNCILDYD